MPEKTDIKNQIDKLTVDSNTLARLFCVTVRSVERYAKDAGMPKFSHGHYNLVECIQWYVQHLVSRGAGGEDAGIMEERRLLVRTQRQRIELEIQHRRRELLDAEEVGRVLAESATIYATHLEALPAARVVNKLSSMSDAKELREYLREECHAIRSSTSASFTAFAVSILDGGHSTATAKTQRRRMGGRKKSTTARSSRTRKVEN